MMPQIDGEKIKQNALQGGNSAKEAFSELWNYFYPRLLRFASSFRNLSASEYDDHVSDILIKAFQKIDRYNPAFALSTWIYKIAENHFNDVFRKNKRNSFYSIEDSKIKMVTDTKIADAAADHDLLEQCKEVINLLKDDDQKIAFLKFYESMSSSEIGKILGIPSGTIRWRISMIRDFIQSKIGDRYEN